MSEDHSSGQQGHIVATVEEAEQQRARLRIAVVPPVPALLPQHAGVEDPVGELRRAAHQVVRDLLTGEPTRVIVLHDPPDRANVERGVSEPLGARVAQHLLDEAGYAGEIVWGQQPWPLPDVIDAAVLVMANGSARRGEKAPGHLDERASAFDEEVEAALRSGEGARLATLDARLGADLMAAGIAGLQQLGPVLTRPAESDVRWSGDPWGVQYWVVLLTARNSPADAMPRVGEAGRA